MTYIIKANTPDRAKAEIVKWLNGMASNRRVDASKTSKVAIFKQHAHEAAAYEAAAAFIEKIVIQGEG